MSSPNHPRKTTTTTTNLSKHCDTIRCKCFTYFTLQFASSPYWYTTNVLSVMPSSPSPSFIQTSPYRSDSVLAPSIESDQVLDVTIEMRWAIAILKCWLLRGCNAVRDGQLAWPNTRGSRDTRDLSTPFDFRSCDSDLYYRSKPTATKPQSKCKIMFERIETTNIIEYLCQANKTSRLIWGRVGSAYFLLMFKIYLNNPKNDHWFKIARAKLHEANTAMAKDENT